MGRALLCRAGRPRIGETEEFRIAMNQNVSSGSASRSLVFELLPLASVMFVAFFVTGIAMPVLPLHVNQTLGFGATVVGLVAGSQFSASLISRLWSGGQADKRGGKWAIIVGLLVASAAGFVYLLSLRFLRTPTLSVGILLLGRGILGGAESFIVTGIMSWGMAIGGPKNAGKVLSWLGTPMFAAFALGAPVGSLLYAAYGFVAVGMATAATPLLALWPILWKPGPKPSPRKGPSFRSVASGVAVPGLGVALSSVGFGAVTTFITLVFVAHGWGDAWITFTAVCVGYMLPRLVFGHLPDKIGGAKVALRCILVEAVGQVMIWLAPSPLVAYAGAAMTGLGYSLVFPSFGVEAVRGVDPECRGLAMGAFTSCLDVALGLSGPLLGLVADHVQEVDTIFMVGALVVSSGAGVALWLQRRGAGAAVRLASSEHLGVAAGGVQSHSH